MSRLPALPFVPIACALVLALVTPLAAQHAPLFRPEDLALLEAPDRDDYQQPERVMDVLQISDGSVVGDLGAGGGWFTVRLARRVGPNGRVYAEDVQPQMIAAIQRRIAREGLRNVTPRLGTAVDPMLPPKSLDAALIVDSYYEIAQPVALLRNLAKSLKADGRIAIINAKKDGLGPGPAMDERVDADTVIHDAAAAGLALKSRESFLRYQYMLIFDLARR